ncbi:putative Tic20 family protein [Paenibacillus sp. DS2015]|uniref:hypothetical protein n=1 Tax=Paenibacillus sp. DS2015 TaxID=3373917 RepID=UPI003D1DF73C
MDSHESHDIQQQPYVENEHFNPTLSFQPPLQLKHSGPGIASLIISLVSLLGYIVIVAVAGAIIGPYLDSSGTGFVGSPTRDLVTNLTTLGIILIVMLLSNLVGTLLGIIGVSLKNRKKVLAIMGLILNSIILVIIAAFFVISVISATATT